MLKDEEEGVEEEVETTEIVFDSGGGLIEVPNPEPTPIKANAGLDLVSPIKLNLPELEGDEPETRSLVTEIKPSDSEIVTYLTQSFHAVNQNIAAFLDANRLEPWPNNSSINTNPSRLNPWPNKLPTLTYFIRPKPWLRNHPICTVPKPRTGSNETKKFGKQNRRRFYQFQPQVKMKSGGQLSCWLVKEEEIRDFKEDLGIFLNTWLPFSEGRGIGCRFVREGKGFRCFSITDYVGQGCQNVPSLVGPAWPYCFAVHNKEHERLLVDTRLKNEKGPT
ncbi:hypothetical protein QYF36_004604 [Acer negundo]|nr:hypothetical protein QYF36_004604 [Acer negundo]